MKTQRSLLILFCLQLCVNGFSQFSDNKENLFIVLGEKISVKSIGNVIANDGTTGYHIFQATFKLEKTIKGEIYKDTIKFKSFEHSEKTGLEKMGRTILFLGRDEINPNEFQVLRYLYNPVFESVNGRLFGLTTVRTNKKPKPIEVSEYEWLKYNQYFQTNKNPLDMKKGYSNGKEFFIVGFPLNELIEINMEVIKRRNK